MKSGADGPTFIALADAADRLDGFLNAAGWDGRRRFLLFELLLPEATDDNPPRLMSGDKLAHRLEHVAEALPLSCDEWAALASAILPELFDAPTRPESPTRHPAGSEGKIRAMEARAAAGRELWHPSDACTVRDDRLSKAPTPRRLVGHRKRA